jgi:hypothetical protein
MHTSCRGLRPWLGLLAGAVLIGIAGCGGGAYSVSGQLEYEDKQPVKELAGFTITFTSDVLQKSARGEIKEDGTFRLFDGAFPGEYKVIVDQPHPNPERGEHRQPVVDLVYEDPVRTPLVAEVKAQSNQFTFTLNRIKRAPRR